VGVRVLPDGPGATLVTETFRLQPFPAGLRTAVRDGEGWRDAMTASLARLELLAKAAGQRNQWVAERHHRRSRATLPLTVAGVAVAQARPGAAMHLPGSAPAPAGLTAGYRTTFGPGRLRTQNNQLCARQGLCHQAQSPVQNGGDALAMDVEPGSLTVTASLGEQRRIADLACPSIGVGP
jgi:hypothetical protein